MSKKLTLEQQAEEIIRIAEENGVQGNYFFLTTFERYQTQIEVLKKLKAEIETGGVLVTKQYVKGRENVYTSPAVADYNRTADSANKTLSTLLKIIKSFNVEESTEETDPLLLAINGGDDE